MHTFVQAAINLRVEMYTFAQAAKNHHVKTYTQEDLIIVEGELIIHRKAYLRIQRLAKSSENIKKINKIKGNNHRRGLRAPVVMVVVSFNFIDFLCVFLGFRQSLYP